MKNLKNIFTLLAVLGLATTANAQTANITASAEVLAIVTVENTADLDFGSFLDGTSSTQALTTANIANLGLVTVSGQSASANIDFAINAPDSLTAAGAFDNLPFAPTATLAQSSDVDGGTDYTFDGSNDGTVNVASSNASDYQVYVGGTVDAGTGLGDFGGTYSGTIVITVSYN